MGILDTISGAIGGKHGMDISKIDLPLSSSEASTMNDLISKGTFKDKSDFMSFLASAYVKNNVGKAASGGQSSLEPLVVNIISASGIAKGFSEGDIKSRLVPLMITGFMAIYKYMASRKHAARAA